jgi:hypothetical protein
MLGIVRLEIYPFDEGSTFVKAFVRQFYGFHPSSAEDFLVCDGDFEPNIHLFFSGPGV